MATTLDGNITKSFIFDTWAASMNGKNLREFMKNKHGWSDQQFKEYHGIYMSTIFSEQVQTALDDLNPPEYRRMEVS